MLKKILTLAVLSMFVILPLFQTCQRDVANAYELDCNENTLPGIASSDSILDVQYIYNVTKALSNIIFTEYDEEHGEIAKGRFFGSKGEHKAAEILYENMTMLGLHTIKDQIQNIEIKNRPELAKLTHQIDVLDYGLKVNNQTVDCHIVPATMGPRENPTLLDYNFSFKDLQIKQKPKFLLPFKFKEALLKENTDYVFIEEESSFIYELQPLYRKILIKFVNPLRLLRVPLLIRNMEKAMKMTQIYENLPHCKGIIRYDYNMDTYNMGASGEKLPIIYINGTVGKKILKDINNATVDFYLNQRYNDSVVSYNVIGQLNGTDPTKTVIVDCLYDSWWCQGTADSAIGMAMVLGVAKYFKDHNITPKYNMKFIGFCGEEVGLRGATYYEAANNKENIIYVIDLNQLGFRQETPKLALNIISNEINFLRKIWNIVKKIDYEKKTGYTSDLIPVWIPTGAPSDDQIFALHRPLRCKTLCFLKSYFWVLHHRDGLDHTEGDVLKYFDWDDVNATGEIVLQVAKYLVGS